jgi:hypothetical protein
MTAFFILVIVAGASRRLCQAFELDYPHAHIAWTSGSSYGLKAPACISIVSTSSKLVNTIDAGDGRHGDSKTPGAAPTPKRIQRPQ